MFKKYNSIENSYRLKFVNSIKEQIGSSMQFVVEEKVHGSNFSFIYTVEHGVQLGKRSGLIDNEWGFNRSDVLREKYEDRIVSMCQTYFPDSETVQVFGEIFGGNYPNLKTPYVKVQKGVFYTNDIEFYGFDILVDGVYLDIDERNQLFEQFDIFYAKPLKFGTLEECLNYPNEFDSFIPVWLGMPKLDVPNICEGTIIKPIVNTYLNNGKRVVLKNKNDKFKEKAHANDRQPKIVEYSDNLNKCIEEVALYVTKNRLDNVLSKDVYELPKEMGRLMKNYAADVLDDFIKDNEEIYNLLEKGELKILKKNLGKLNAKLILKYT